MRTYFYLFMALAGVFGINSAVVQNAAAKELHLFVGAGLRQPLDQLVQEFQTKTGHRIYTDFSGSGQLMTRIQAGAPGDLFIPGALFYIEKLKKAGKLDSYSPIVAHTPVIGVNRKQTGEITSFDDLTKTGVRLAMGDPKAMAFGRTAMEICERSGRKAAIMKNVTVYGATVKQLALYVAQGTVDAAIIGRADAFQNRTEIALITIPKDYFTPEIIAAAVLKNARDVPLARTLCNYLSSDRGVEIFKTHGFLPIEE